MIAYRNAQRLIHISFYKAEISNSESCQLELEETMTDKWSSASAAIGHLIRILEPLTSSTTRESKGDHLLQFVASHLPNLHFQVKKCYALVLAAGQLVSPVYHRKRII